MNNLKTPIPQVSKDDNLPQMSMSSDYGIDGNNFSKSSRLMKEYKSIAGMNISRMLILQDSKLDNQPQIESTQLNRCN
jgi:hypothetical protein